MPAHATWKGSLNVSLVSVAVKASSFAFRSSWQRFSFPLRLRHAGQAVTHNQALSLAQSLAVFSAARSERAMAGLRAQ